MLLLYGQSASRAASLAPGTSSEKNNPLQVLRKYFCAVSRRNGISRGNHAQGVDMWVRSILASSIHMDGEWDVPAGDLGTARNGCSWPCPEKWVEEKFHTPKPIQTLLSVFLPTATLGCTAQPWDACCCPGCSLSSWVKGIAKELKLTALVHAHNQQPWRHQLGWQDFSRNALGFFFIYLFSWYFRTACLCKPLQECCSN